MVILRDSIASPLQEPHRWLELPPGSVQQPVLSLASRIEWSPAAVMGQLLSQSMHVTNISYDSSLHMVLAMRIAGIPASRAHRRAPSCLLSSMRGCLIRTPSMTTTMVCFQPPPLERERPVGSYRVACYDRVTGAGPHLGVVRAGLFLRVEELRERQYQPNAECHRHSTCAKHTARRTHEWWGLR